MWLLGAMCSMCVHLAALCQIRPSTPWHRETHLRRPQAPSSSDETENNSDAHGRAASLAETSSLEGPHQVILSATCCEACSCQTLPRGLVNLCCGASFVDLQIYSLCQSASHAMGIGWPFGIGVTGHIMLEQRFPMHCQILPLDLLLW